MIYLVVCQKVLSNGVASSDLYAKISFVVDVKK